MPETAQMTTAQALLRFWNEITAEGSLPNEVLQDLMHQAARTAMADSLVVKNPGRADV